MTRHLLEVDDLTPAELVRVLALARRPDPPAVLAGRGVGLVFEKPSTRTRHSTELAVVQLGGHPVSSQAAEVGLDTRESAEDVARTLACYHAAIGARVYEHAKVERMAAAVDVPVVNLLSEDSHPLQALADLLTVEDALGRLAGVRLAYVGDFNNVARSLGLAAAMTGMEVAFGCPAGFGPAPADLDRMAFALEGAPPGAAGEGVAVTHRPADAVEGADVVYTDVWASMGHEAEAEQRRRSFEGFTVDDGLVRLASRDAIVLHDLPAHRGEEITASVLDSHRSRVWLQAANRMSAARGALLFLLGEGR